MKLLLFSDLYKQPEVVIDNQQICGFYVKEDNSLGALTKFDLDTIEQADSNIDRAYAITVITRLLKVSHMTAQDFYKQIFNVE